MRTEQVLDIVDGIYRAALGADEWGPVFAALQQGFRSPVAGMFTQDIVTGAYSADRLPLEEKYHRLYAERIAAVNPWIRVPGLMRPGRVLTDQSLEALRRDPKAYVETEFHQDFARPQGFRHVMGGTLITHGHALVNFTYFRDVRAGPYTKAEMRLHARLARHMANAVGMRRELSALRQQIAASTYLIDRLAFGVILLGPGGSIQFANREAQRILALQDGLSSAGSVLHAEHPSDARKLKTLIRGLTSRLAENDVSIARTIISRPSGRMAFSIAAMPVPRGWTMLDTSAGAILLLVTDPERRPVLESRYLAERFGLGPNETRLAVALAQGSDLRQAALMAGLTYETARWYLKAIFEKTGTRRQTQLVSLLVADLAASAVITPTD
jgi:DNA-binding CsgD family transcriptional regulator